ncbi:uncharacterized protein LOC118736407 [Rhagoletis pomonella]|uniref:uncharacterized protein LOC118736407 n=1 Tax=Rhagoletis pomonella TaxID=28610 RepID=UPI001786ECAD|nr:uncharacterized protein LOC118736407 [Rhagoletis pomonella]
MLHDNDQKQMQPAKSVCESPAQPLDVDKKPVLSCSSSANERKLLFRILPVTLHGGGKTVETYALFDEGSSVTLVDSTISQKLGLNGLKRSLNLQWYGGRATQEPTVVVDLFVSGTGMKKKHKLRNVYSVSNLNLPTQSLSEADLRSSSRHKQKLPLEPYSGAVPKLLIGLDHCHLGMPAEIMQINCIGPYAANTELGWTVFGPSVETSSSTQVCLFTKPASDQAMHDMIAEYFETESFGVKPFPPVESAADLRAKAILHSTTRRTNGRYETGLLWKYDDIEMPDSYEMARKRLISIEKKMQRDDNFAKVYKQIINLYVSKEYARKLRPEEAAAFTKKTWYLPHFGVVNLNKPAKLRLVFDAAAETHGVSLNSLLLKGPQDYRALPTILFHFREGAVAVCGDIKEMFHQIVIRPDDRCAQRFLWRDGDTTREPDVYEMIAMTFGAACSPCAAQYIKTLNAMEHSDNAARAVKAILDYHYVDDFVDSFRNVEEAITVSVQVRAIHRDAGFELRNFTSNSPDVFTALGGVEATIAIANKTSLSMEKVLGMFWQPSIDSFVFRLNFHNVDKRVVSGERRPTKIELRSIIMSIFDPLGFLSHITIAAKLIMREVWRQQSSWDSPLPDDISASWERWRQELPAMVELEIPRFYFRNGTPTQRQLHVFVDASEEAFAAVAYWRAINSTGEVEIAFICSKAKCAPLKPLTVPRLELQAAVLGTRLLQTIREEHSVNASSCMLWTDSKTVVNWIKSEHRRYKQFVAHRVAEILATTTPSNWRWIPTGENVADEATRADGRSKNRSTSRWLCGPSFLLAEESKWPSQTVVDNNQPEVEELRPKYALVITSESHWLGITVCTQVSPPTCNLKRAWLDIIRA